MNETFINISKIIERDSKSTTYKFALLRGTIDIIQENSPFIKIKTDSVEIPLGLLIIKWMIYYYPLLDGSISISQINGVNSKLAFQDKFRPLINYYNTYGGLSAFYNDLRVKGISEEVNSEFYELVKELRRNIVINPMKFIGKSINKSEYSIYNYQNNASLRNTEIQNSNWLIRSCGTFSIPIKYFDAFKILGSFISGSDNVLFKWAEFSVNASGKKLSSEKILSEILKSPITERDVLCSKQLYKNILKESGTVSCVWTGYKLIKYDIDHIIPFSIWKNNDLWNLLPAKAVVNSNKRDKIPSSELITKRKDAIIHYWEIIKNNEEQRFLEELQITLLGNNHPNNWQSVAFEQLLNTSKYLIETRGYEQWNI